MRLGRISYGVYLWHFVIFKAINHSGIALTAIGKLLWIGVSIAAAALSWVAIEPPASRHKDRFAARTQSARSRSSPPIVIR